MPSFAVSLAFLLAAGQPPAETAATTTPTTAPATAPAEEPKMVCKYEHLTGSRVQKQKVCRPENQTSGDIDTKLQRQMARSGDAWVQGEGNISAGAGIGN